MSEFLKEPSPESAEQAPAIAAVVLPPMPGRALKEARISAGISVDEVARALKFSVRQVVALESDDYQILQGTTFIRGFVRSYAKFLRLDPSPLLALIEQSIPSSPMQVAAPANMGEASPKPFFERHQRVLLIVLLCLVAGAIAAYVYSRGDANPFPSLTSDSPRDGESAPAKEPTLAAPAAEPVPVAATAAPAVVPATAPESASAPVSPTPVVINPGERQISLDFESRTWVEIKDGANRIVLTGEFPGGARQVATGKPPFNLWIGKASGVRVTYGEKRVDLTPYARDDVARLSLE